MDYDLFFYLYCFRLNRSEEEFYRSTMKKVIKMLDIANDEAAMKAAGINNQPYTPRYFEPGSSQAETISSMKEVEGFE